MEKILPLVPIGAFFIVLLIVGMVASYRANNVTHFKKEYFLGSQNLGGVVLAMTLVATYGSVSSFISGPGVAWDKGYGWVVFAAPQIITAFLILGLVGKRMTILAHRTNSLTVIDLIYERFKSKSLCLILAIMLIVFFTAMTVGQFIGGAQIFAGLTNIDYSLGLVIFALVTVLYSSGGFRAVAITDTICAVLMLTGMGILVYVIISEGQGLEAINQTLSTIKIDEQTNISKLLEFNAGGDLPLSLLFSSWILVGFATIGLPQSLVRCMGYKNSHDLHKSMIIATLVCGALMIGMTLLGVLSRAIITTLPQGGTDRVIPTLIATKMHPIIAGITILGPLAATMSTVSSLLIASSSAVVRDLFKALAKNSNNYVDTEQDANLKDQSSQINKPLNQKQEDNLIQESLSFKLSYHEKIIIKGTTYAVGIISILLALYPLDIVVWVNLFAFGGLECTFLWTIVLGLFSSKVNKTGILISVLSSLSVYTIFSIFKINILAFHAIVPSLVVGLIAAIIGTYIGKYWFKERLDWQTHAIFFPHKPYCSK